MPFNTYVTEWHRLVSALIDAGIYSGTFYSGGRSRRDALSRPFDFSAPEGLRTWLLKNDFGPDPAKQNGIISVWAPEFEGVRIVFVHFAEGWLYLQLEFRENRSERISSWLDDLLAKRQFDGLICVRDMRPETAPILRLIHEGRDIDISGMSADECLKFYLQFGAKIGVISPERI